MGRASNATKEQVDEATYKPESADLECTSGGHSKEYHLQLIESESGWAVTAQSGKIGSTMHEQPAKYRGPDYLKAKKVFDQTLKEKLTKNPPYHYTEGKKPVQSVTRGGIVVREVDFSPELLLRITEHEARAFAARKHRYNCQRKRDGERLVAVFRDGAATGRNKNGETIQLDRRLAEAIREYCVRMRISRLMLDGEAEREFWAWDLLECVPQALALPKPMSELPYRARHELLSTVVDGMGNPMVRLVPFEPFDELIKERGTGTLEGIVVKDLEAPYRPGRNGQHFKWKFEEAGTVIVGPKERADNHRSVGMYAVNGGGKLRYMGKVGVPDKYPLPQNGDRIDIRYLYRWPGVEGKLYQPKYFGKIRKDVGPQACTVEQFVVKQEA